jgi:hypothetical protein
MIPRRRLLQGVSAGTGGLLIAPLLQKIEAHAAGRDATPRRLVFVTFDNGFHEEGAQPVGVPLATDRVTTLSLEGLTLPFDLEPFAPYRDRMTIVQGLRGYHVSPSHGAGFGALSGLPFSKTQARGESIDAAVAAGATTVFPLVVLGIAAGQTMPSAFVSSAWGGGRPIAAHCRPELAHEMLFGSVGADRNTFANRKQLLDFVTDDLKLVRRRIAGPERELLDSHVDALETMTARQGVLSHKYEAGELARHAPPLPDKPAATMTEIAAAQCDIAAAALVSGLTNVVTITSGLCGLKTTYTGLTNSGVHLIGHGTMDPELKLTGYQVLSRYRRYLAEQLARLLGRLAATPEGAGTMLDNTVLVFTSDSANWQHSGGENWPFVLVGDLGGRLQGGRFVSYPLANRPLQFGAPGQRDTGLAHRSNPTINALYCTLLHAAGKPRDTFNHHVTKEPAALYGPLGELLA